MKRPFISLYLILSISVLGIGWTLDSIWQNNVEDSGATNAPLVALAKLLATHPKNERAKLLAQIGSNRLYPLQLLDSKQIALIDSDQLSTDKVLVTAHNDQHELHFIKLDKQQILMAGPIELAPNGQLRRLFTLLFYLSLALVVLLWVWPLSRDLQTLRLATKAFGQAKWDTQIQLPPHSKVLPLAHTFNEMAKHISALIENQRHLSNAVSHEIRTPLARFKFALALMPQYCHPDTDIERREAFLAEMQQDVEEMENLLQELLTYASLETRRHSQPQTLCDLALVVRQTIERLQHLSPVPINFTITGDERPVSADPALIDRALQNLLVNAQRFAKQQIQVELSFVNKGVSISVTDDGEGIAPEEQSKIFEPFYRCQATAQDSQGHGLGLAIIKRIMQWHQGEVTLTSKPGETQFTLSW